MPGTISPRRDGGTSRVGQHVTTVLTAGLKYNGFETCGCSREPKFCPRAKAQVRSRLRLAARTGIDEAVMLAARDPDHLASAALEANVPADSQAGWRVRF